MKWFRHRRNRPALDERALADTWQLVSLLLDYPDAQLLERLPLFESVAATLPTPQRDLLTAYLTTVQTTPSVSCRRTMSTPSTSPASARCT